MSYWKDYCYVDAQYTHKDVSTRWIRLQADHVSSKFVPKAKGSNCFTTVQRFKDATSLLEQERVREEARVNGHELSPEELLSDLKEGDDLPDCQIRYHGLFFDFDCDHKQFKLSMAEAVDRSQEDAKKLVHWIFMTFPDMNPAHVQCWFSGRKGFHILVRPEAFGMKPHVHLTYIVRMIAFELADTLKLATMDRAVYSRRRMWRIPNTVHPKSGKFKIELTVDELLSWSATKILEESSEPRCDTGLLDHMAWSHVWDVAEYKNIEADELAARWYQERYAHYEAYKDLQRLRPRRGILNFDDAGGEYPSCVKDLLTNGPKDGGPKRNRIILPLAGFMYDSGLDREEAHQLIKEWTEEFYPDRSEIKDRLSNGRSVVESAYRGQTKFSCRFIRSCNGSGEKGRVACVGEEKCNWIADPADQEPETIPLIHLSQASKGCYSGTKIRTPVHVATIAGRPFQIPSAGKVRCTPNDSAKICENCPNNNSQAGGQLEWTFASDDRHILNLINVNDNIKKGTIKAKCEIPQKCYRCWIEVKEMGNVEEIQVIPMVDYAHAYSDEEVGEDEASKQARHVVSLAYYMGHGIEPNKKYIIEATPYGHPKDQRVCYLFDKAEAAQNDIDHFRMTPDLHSKLKIFQAKKGQSIEKKMREIHRDLTANVHRIGGRFDLSIGVDLCYHSVIGFSLVGEDVNKGWFELVVIGDTSTGKSTLIQRMMQHYGLGELIAGEQAKRTGLVYASIQLQGQWVLVWGKIPQNDRRLLVIDEFSGIPMEEVSKMTQLRSEGKAQGGGVNAHYETFARTRMIFLTNARGNKGSLEGGNYGIEAFDELFEERADLRRVDLGMVMEEKDVDKDLVYKRWDKVNYPHRYTADLCRNLILWAWSRNPKHVEWKPGAEDEVILWAERLGDTYECDLPLAIRTDLKIKISRIAVACAARLFSTDEEGKKVIVTREHVEYVSKFIDQCYRKRAMSFFQYAKAYKRANNFTEKKRELIRETMDSFDTERDSIVTALLKLKLFNKGQLTDMVNLGNDELKRLWKFMIQQGLLENKSRGYRKSPAFTTFLKGMGVKSSGYAADDSHLTGGNFDEGGFDDEEEELTDLEEKPVLDADEPPF